MMNMSYCRFENTLKALQEARKTWRDFEKGEIEPLSESELQSLKDLMHEMSSFLEEVFETDLTEAIDEDWDQVEEKIDDCQALCENPEPMEDSDE